MEKKRNFFNPKDEVGLFEEEVVDGEEKEPEDDEIKEPEDGEEKEEELEDGEETEQLDPAAAGCRAFGDTVLVFPSLPEKPLVDYRAEVVQECFRNQPSVMELEVTESVK